MEPTPSPEQRILQTVAQFAAGIAHEVNNPLGFIMSNIETLRKYTKSLVNIADCVYEDSLLAKRFETVVTKKKYAFLREDLEQLLSESDEGLVRIAELTQKLKLFSDLDTVSDQSLVDINNSLDNSLKIIAPQIPAGTGITTHFQSQSLVSGNSGELNQVFINLLLNALQAFEEKKSNKQITVSTWDVEDQCWCSVQDNGDGIDPDVVGKIFDPFFTTKKIGTAVGLGLSIARTIMLKHRGSVSVESKGGQGTKVLLSFPVCR